MPRERASTTLYNATQRLSHEEVFHLYERQYYEELPVTGDPEMDDIGIPLTRLYQDMQDTISISREIIEKHMTALYAEMKTHEHEGVQAMGNALETADYTYIAI